MLFAMKSQKILGLILVTVCGLLFLHHHCYYQPMLSSGDHGRDLYAFQVTLKGHVPYQDYWWVYGPLMPYYYALFLKIFGVSIQSALIGKMVLTLISGLFIFAALRLLVPELVAMLGAVWLWTFNPEFFFTYNHAGGVTVLTIITYFLISYILQRKPGDLFKGLAAVFILCLIKINFGLAALFVYTVSVLAVHRFIPDQCPSVLKRFLFLACVGLPMVAGLIYLIFLQGLPLYVIRQCLPYYGDDQPYHAPVWSTLSMWWEAIALNINNSWGNRSFALLVIISIFSTAYETLKSKSNARERIPLMLIISTLCLFYVVNLHEYLVSGVLYRTFWSTPFSVMMMFLFIGLLLGRLSPVIRMLLFVTIFLIPYLVYLEHDKIVKNKLIPEQALPFERGKIITGNDVLWCDTVKITTEILKSTLKDHETFFALPYDPLYYFLTDKTTPTPNLIYFEHIHIPEKQERAVIADLEAKKVNYVLLSSRAFSDEPGLGILGKTYCPLLGKYIFENFTAIATIGDWINPPGWGWNHGTKILQRK
jgi:hypothetical protein